MFKPNALKSSIALAMGIGLPVALLSPASSLAQEDAQAEEIVVTGSRILRRDFEAASPILTVDSDTFEQVSTLGVESALNQLPQFVPAGTQFVSGDVQASAFNSPGISSLNLRGLGPNRNLVLVDGRRAQPANATLVVDVNTIPAAAIESVEVISGGASATYGADAIAGVVNFKLRDNYEGIQIDAQTSATEHGGGEETRISGLIGGNFDSNRGNVMLGAEWAQREAVFTRDRDFYTNAWADPGTPGGEALTQTYFNPGFANNPSQAVIDGMGFTGATPLQNFYLNPDGSLFINDPVMERYTGPLAPERKILDGNTSEPGTLSQNNIRNMVSSPLDRYSMFAKAQYDITDNVTAFIQANFSELEVNQVLAYSPASSLWAATVPRDGRALPAELEALLASRPDPDADWTMERVLDFMGPRRSHNESSVYQVMAGIEGSLGDSSWQYEAYASHGKTTVLNFLEGFASLERYRTLVAAPDFGRNYFPDAAFGGYVISCTSGLPIVEEFEISQDCRDSIAANMKNWTTLSQDIVEANFTGDLFELPAGTVGSAFGISYRENAVQFEPDLLNDAQSIIDSPIGLFAANNTKGSTRVKEYYGEVLVPVLADLPLVQDLSLELGARYSDYDTTGSVWTYKALGDWTLNDSVRLRGGYQLANRAPNTAELFTGPTQQVVGFPGSDPCASDTTNSWGNVPSNPNRAQVQALCNEIINANGANNDSVFWSDPDNFTGPFGFFPLELDEVIGNPDLDNEEAETWTFGVVFNLFDSLTMSLDWYQIEVSDAIAPLDSFTTYRKCLNADGTNPNFEFNEFCELITRDPITGERQQVEAPYFNLGSIETSGVDVQINYAMDLAGGGLSFTSIINYLDTYKTQATEDSEFVENKGTLAQGGQFDYRIFNTVSYFRDNWGLGLRHRYLPEIESAGYALDPTTTTKGANDYNILDMFGHWNFSDALSVRAGIDNLLDTQPEIVGRTPGQTNASGSTSAGFYDTLGRRFYLGAQLRY